MWFEEPSSQDLWSLGWVSSYMAHDSMDFSPTPLDVFQTLSFAKALVNGFCKIIIRFNIIHSYDVTTQIRSHGTVLSSYRSGFIIVVTVLTLPIAAVLSQ